MCLWLCTASLHNTTQNSFDNLRCYLQTTIVAQTLSFGGEGGHKKVGSSSNDSGLED